MIEPLESAAETGAIQPPDRACPRAQVEIMARFRRYTASSTVVLKDLTPFGARVEGVGALRIDEMVILALPGCRPSAAFVVWANAHCAGLEFTAPLADAQFRELVSRYGRPGAGSACG